MIQTNTKNTKDMSWLNTQLNSFVGFLFAFGGGVITVGEILTAAVMGFVGAFCAAAGTWAFKKMTSK